MAGSLTEADIVAARAEVALGRPVPVWFTPEAVGVASGGSARIIAVGEPPEGEFLQVRPTGSRDEMFCSPGELTRTRPSRRRAAPEQARAPEPERRPVRRATAAAVAGPSGSTVPAGATVADPAPAAEPAVKPARRARRKAVAEPAEATPTPRRTARAQPVEVTVSLHAGVEGEWQVSVVAGKRTVVRPTAVAAADVAKAAQCLPDEVGAAVQESLAAARTRQLDRVAQLQAELAEAQQTLAELGG